MARAKTTASLATALLLGSPAGDDKGWYSKRKYLKPGRKRELAARVALAIELRKEAPDGYFANLLAALIDPRPPRQPTGIMVKRVVPKQTIKFTPPKGGRRASDRGDLDIAQFMREWLEAQEPKHRKIDAAVYTASVYFHVSERRVEKAWEQFGD
jgi:hypothetical protein